MTPTTYHRRAERALVHGLARAFREPFAVCQLPGARKSRPKTTAQKSTANANARRCSYPHGRNVFSLLLSYIIIFDLRRRNARAATVPDPCALARAFRVLRERMLLFHHYSTYITTYILRGPRALALYSLYDEDSYLTYKLYVCTGHRSL